MPAHSSNYLGASWAASTFSAVKPQASPLQSLRALHQLRLLVALLLLKMLRLEEHPFRPQHPVIAEHWMLLLVMESGGSKPGPLQIDLQRLRGLP